LKKSKNISEDKARETAERVMSFFGFEDAIIDNILASRDRDIFYMLESVGILKTLKEEVTVKRGHIWRIHYWLLNKEKIFEWAEGEKKEKKEATLQEVYESINDEVWHKHSEEM